MQDLKTELYQLRFGIEKSIRYHQRRLAHYEWIHRALMFVVIVLGSSALAKPFGHPELFGMASAVFAAIDLVWGLSHKARDHQALRKQFSDLSADMEEQGETTDEATLREWKARRIRIEANEPPTFWAVERDCENEIAVALGHDDHYAPLSLRKRLLMNWFRFDRIDPPPVAASC